jgi:hypothetical protein
MSLRSQSGQPDQSLRHKRALNFTAKQTLASGAYIEQTKIALPLVAPSLNDFRRSANRPNDSLNRFDQVCFISKRDRFRMFQ